MCEAFIRACVVVRPARGKPTTKSQLKHQRVVVRKALLLALKIALASPMMWLQQQR